MNSRAKVSVVMPTHNDARYLPKALESVLAQNFQDFELIIVDDHSTDETSAILSRYVQQDERLRVLRNETNMGVAHSLNLGLNAAQGTYIARMDSDDISCPERFERQVEFLETHPEVGVVGTQLLFIDEDGHFSPQPAWEPVTSSARILWQLLCGPPLCESSTMMRTDCVRTVGGYEPAYLNADMQLWGKLAFVTKLRNLDEVLIRYRQPPQHHREQLLSWESHAQSVTHNYVERLLNRSIDKWLIQIYTVYMRSMRIVPKATHFDVFRLCSLLREIFMAMKQNQLLDDVEAAEVEKRLIEQTQGLVTAAFDSITISPTDSLMCLT